MPTPILIDGFEHNSPHTSSFSGSHLGLWTTIETSASFSWPAGRNGDCMQLAPSATTCRGIKTLAGHSILVGSFYFKIVSLPAGTTDILSIQNAAFSQAFRLLIQSDGKLQCLASTGSSTTAAAYNNAAWHRVDFRCNLTANPWTADWQVDGVAQTSATYTDVASTATQCMLGVGSAATYTMQFDDLVLSATSGDYPLGAHDVLYGVPTGDGTHVAGTNVIEDNAGTDITSPNAFPLMDEWVPNTSDYVQQIATGASNYAEVTFDDQPGGKTIWGVEGVASLFASGTAASADGTTRIVDASGNTLTDIYSGDMSETGLNYRRAIITAPAGGWDGAGYAGVKARVGFSSAVTSVPRWTALMLQYAVTDATAPSALRSLQVNVSPRRW